MLSHRVYQAWTLGVGDAPSVLAIGACNADLVVAA